MHGPFQIRKGKQVGGRVVTDLFGCQICHFNQSGVIHTVGIDSPEKQVWWLLTIGGKSIREKNGLTHSTPIVEIITDLDVWLPVTKTSKTTRRAYFDIYEDDHAFRFIQMDCRDKKFIREQICQKLNL